MTIRQVSLRRLIELELEEFLDRAFYDEAITEWAKSILLDEKVDHLRLITQLRFILDKARADIAEEYETV